MHYSGLLLFPVTSCQRLDSPVDSDLMDTLIHRHRLCHGDDRPLVAEGAYCNSQGKRLKKAFVSFGYKCFISSYSDKQWWKI